MQEVFEKIIEELEAECFLTTNDDGETNELSIKVVDLKDAIEIVRQAAAEYNNGWIPCGSETMPPQPEENPFFDNEPLELYLVSAKGADCSFRAFWNGKFFTDGWSKVNVTAWQPLPEPYQPKQ